MTSPIRINCESTTKIPPLEELQEVASSGHHVVLQFPGRVEKDALILQLSAALPDHSVFDSGGNSTTDWVTVMPVVARETVLAHAPEIRAAVAAYIETCSTMITKYEEGSLSDQWSSARHGGHRRFENRSTGQIIEAPLCSEPDPSQVDPYFFAVFVKSTSGLEVVAEMLNNDFHDADRMLDILFGET